MFGIECKQWKLLENLKFIWISMIMGYIEVFVYFISLKKILHTIGFIVYLRTLYSIAHLSQKFLFVGHCVFLIVCFSFMQIYTKKTDSFTGFIVELILNGLVNFLVSVPALMTQKYRNS